MGFYEDLIEGLETAIREDHDGKISRLAKDADTHPSTLTRIVEKERTKWLSQIARIADTAGLQISRKDQLVPVTPMALHGRPGEAAIVRPGEEVPEGIGGVVPVYQFAAGGLPVEITEAEPICEVCIPRRFVFPGLMVVQVVGKSMEPLIKDGAYVGINRHAAKLVPGNVYAVNIPYEGLTIKRVFLDVDNRSLILKSDNPLHPEQRVPIEDREGLIVGEVIWGMQGI